MIVATVIDKSEYLIGKDDPDWVHQSVEVRERAGLAKENKGSWRGENDVLGAKGRKSS